MLLEHFACRVCRPASGACSLFIFYRCFLELRWLSSFKLWRSRPVEVEVGWLVGGCMLVGGGVSCLSVAGPLEGGKGTSGSGYLSGGLGLHTNPHADTRTPKGASSSRQTLLAFYTLNLHHKLPTGTFSDTPSHFFSVMHLRGRFAP